MAKPITASSKALKMRGYDVDADSGSVEEYSTASAFDNSAETLSNPAEERWYAPGIEGLADELSYKPTLKQMASTVASEAEWGKVLANQPKMVGEWLGELIPMARRMLPVDPTLLFDEDLTWGDVGQSMKYSWFPGVSFAKNMMTTDVKGKNFRKISKTQDHEEMLVPYLEQYRDLHVLTEDKLVDKLRENAPLMSPRSKKYGSPDMIKNFYMKYNISTRNPSPEDKKYLRMYEHKNPDGSDRYHFPVTSSKLFQDFPQQELPK